MGTEDTRPPRVSAHICSNKAELGTTKRPSNRPMGMEDARPPRVSAHICSNKNNLGTPKRPSKCPYKKNVRIFPFPFTSTSTPAL